MSLWFDFSRETLIVLLLRSTALCLLATVALRFVRSARARYIGWCVVLASLLLPPLSLPANTVIGNAWASNAPWNAPPDATLSQPKHPLELSKPGPTKLEASARRNAFPPRPSPSRSFSWPAVWGLGTPLHPGSGLVAGCTSAALDSRELSRPDCRAPAAVSLHATIATAPAGSARAPRTPLTLCRRLAESGDADPLDARPRTRLATGSRPRVPARAAPGPLDARPFPLDPRPVVLSSRRLVDGS